jgi:hypothetical protein
VREEAGGAEPARAADDGGRELLERRQDVGRDRVAGQVDRAAVLVRVALDRVAELVEEGDPALAHVLVELVPVGSAKRAGPDHDHAGTRPVIGELDRLMVLAVVEVQESGRLLAGVVDEDVADLALEAVVVPAEPASDPLGLGERAPDGLPRRVDHHLDAERLLLCHAASVAFGFG